MTTKECKNNFDCFNCKLARRDTDCDNRTLFYDPLSEASMPKKYVFNQINLKRSQILATAGELNLEYFEAIATIISWTILKNNELELKKGTEPATILKLIS